MSGGSAAYGGSGRNGDVYFNYTPLVDVTFNLILYFVLTSTISTAALSRVSLPKPQDSQAIDRQLMPANRVVVNVISSALDERGTGPESSVAKGYEIDSAPIAVGDKAMLVQKFRTKREQQAMILGKDKMDDFYIEVRADRRVRYADVEPILMAASEAKIPKMNITALMDTGH
jgi:biopolymer transport protein ExbD